MNTQNTTKKNLSQEFYYLILNIGYFLSASVKSLPFTKHLGSFLSASLASFITN